MLIISDHVNITTSVPGVSGFAANLLELNVLVTLTETDDANGSNK
jgi:hypothetical protein